MLTDRSCWVWIDPLGDTTHRYVVPPGNPFAKSFNALPELWAYGLRYPQRFTWDRGGTLAMLVVDIGQDTAEEINLGAPGANYGWSLQEGPAVSRPAEIRNKFS